MFYDTDLSGSGTMACSSCHDPKNHYAPRAGSRLPVEYGGLHGRQPGIRAVPSLTYRDTTPAFSVGPVNEANEVGEASPMAVVAGTSDQMPSAVPTATQAPQQAKSAATSAANMVPRGGMFWDGRADTLQAQADGPMMSPFEMANTSHAALAAVIGRKYGPRLAQLFGDTVLKDPEMLIAEADFALARYQVEEPDFHPHTSKLDYYLKGEARLTPQEARGKALYDDPQKGNCADCHPDTTASDGQAPVMTDFEYEALGVPRNMAIPANADPHWYDLGLCGPLRTDSYATEPLNCGMFKTPSLRNVATRSEFMHNGYFKSLTEVVKFYVQRSTDPAAVYHGSDAPDDLPAKYAANLDVVDPPFDRKKGAQPALNDEEIADIVAYLGTFTDGWQPRPASD